MRAIVVETGKEVEVERGEPIDNPMGWHSQMWLTDKEGNMIHEEICTYEVCKLAKEKGFPQQIDFGGYWYATKYYKNSCLGEYFEGERTQVEDYHDKSTIYYFINEGIAISAPTQSLLQRWLREEKGYYVYPFFDNVQLKWDWVCREKTGYKWIPLVGYDFHLFATYELALEDALKYALENLV